MANILSELFPALNLKFLQLWNEKKAILCIWCLCDSSALAKFKAFLPLKNFMESILELKVDWRIAGFQSKQIKLIFRWWHEKMVFDVYFWYWMIRSKFFIFLLWRTITLNVNGARMRKYYSSLCLFYPVFFCWDWRFTG